MKPVLRAATRAARAIGLLLVVTCPMSADAQRIPALSTLSVRLLDSVSGSPGERGRAMRVMVLAPVYQDSRLLVAPRTILEGTVVDAGIQKSRGEPHFLQLAFTSMLPGGTGRVAISAQVVSVDNSRNSVDAQGCIVGPRKPSVVRDKRDWAALVLGTINPVAGIAFFAAMREEQVERYRRIEFPRGTDLTVRLMGDVALPHWPVFPAPGSVGGDSTLRGMVSRLPLQTRAAEGRAAGDFVNIVFIGSEDDVRRAFLGAAWDPPDRGSTRGDFETFIKAAEGQGYAHQPVSRQAMFGRPPDLVYERVTDTFAKRHHLRLWRTGDVWRGVPVWVAAATHDIGIEFSMQYRSFTHRTEDAIDGERDKVVSDLIAEQQVQALSFVQRDPVPDRATRGRVSSDWRVAIVQVSPVTSTR